MSKILRNAMRTPDGTVIESFFRHDYVTHKDANGETYMVDGGMDYLRRTVMRESKTEDLSIFAIDGDHEHNRQYFRWGTYGKNGDEAHRLIFLMDMSTNHINAILETQDHIEADTRALFEEEIKYRGNKEENK